MLFHLSWQRRKSCFLGHFCPNFGEPLVRKQWKQPTTNQLKSHADHIYNIENSQTRYSLHSRVLDVEDNGDIDTGVNGVNADVYFDTYV